MFEPSGINPLPSTAYRYIMKGLSTRHLIGIKNITEDDIRLIFETADNFKEVINRPIKKVPSLRDITVANLFFESSTRTRVSFELAERRLSADIVNFTASSSSVSKGETLLDTVNNILSMKVDMVVMRHPAPGACVYLSTRIPANIINAGDGTHEHPTQALLDALTLRQRLGDIEGRRVVIVGDIVHSRVARSNAHLLTTLGAEVVLVAPPTLLPAGVDTWPVTIAHDLDAELPAADAVMMLRVQAERMNGGFFPSPREYSVRYGLNDDRLRLLGDDAVVLHPGPMLRGMEIGYSVADAPQATVLEQVRNGVHVRMAVLLRLLVGNDSDQQRGDHKVEAGS